MNESRRGSEADIRDGDPACLPLRRWLHLTLMKLQVEENIKVTFTLQGPIFEAADF